MCQMLRFRLLFDLVQTVVMCLWSLPGLTSGSVVSSGVRVVVKALPIVGRGAKNLVGLIEVVVRQLIYVRPRVKQVLWVVVRWGRYGMTCIRLILMFVLVTVALLLVVTRSSLVSMCLCLVLASGLLLLNGVRVR